MTQHHHNHDDDFRSDDRPERSEPHQPPARRFDRVDPLRGEGTVYGARRAAVEAECGRLADVLGELDRQLGDLVARRRTLMADLQRQRQRLWPALRRRGRQPAPDGAEQLPPIPNDATYLGGRRLRAVCLALLSRTGPLALTELHALLHRHRLAVAGRQPVKALADALGYERDQGRASRLSRGVYEAKPGLPPFPRAVRLLLAD